MQIKREDLNIIQHAKNCFTTKKIRGKRKKTLKQWELAIDLKKEVVSLLLLNKLFNKLDKISIGLFKDEILTIIRNLLYLKMLMVPKQINYAKNPTNHLRKSLDSECNLKNVSFLDINLDFQHWLLQIITQT